MQQEKRKWSMSQHRNAARSLKRMQKAIGCLMTWQAAIRKKSSPAGRRLQKLYIQIEETRADLMLQLQREYQDEPWLQIYFPECAEQQAVDL